MARQRKGRAVDGIFLLNKPLGGSSNHALQRVKRLYDAQKAGHTGSLDPLATGVLPVCLGEATKFSQYLLNADKVYRATICLGRLTTTGDVEGDVLEEQDSSAINKQQVLDAIQLFMGDIQQVPPMYSALKVNGQPLYKLAREGIEIKREPRAVHISQFDVLAFRSGEKAEIDVEIACSKGTYIRSLAIDLAASLGLGGHLTALHRTRVGEFSIQEAMTIPELEARKESEGFEGLDTLLISAEEAVNHLPLVEVPEVSGYYVMLGQAVLVPHAPTSGLVRLREEGGRFLGVGEVLDDGRVAPRRLIASK